MKQFILILLLTYSCGLYAQRPADTTRTLTAITTGELMQGLISGGVAWRGESHPGCGTCGADVASCVEAIFCHGVHLLLNPSLLTNYEDGGSGSGGGMGGWLPPVVVVSGGGGGGGWVPPVIWVGGGVIPPIPPYTGGNGMGGGGSTGTAPTNGVTVVIIPPTKPAATDGGEHVGGSSPKDTVQPKNVDCDSFSIKKGLTMTKIMNKLDQKTQTKEIRDSMLNWKYEAGYSIEWDTAHDDYVPYDYSTGSTNSVGITLYTPGKITIGGLHDHPIGKDGYAPGPSARDIYHLIEGFQSNPNYKYDFVLGADGVDWALSATSPGAMTNFMNNYPANSCLNGTEWSNINTIPGIEGGLYDFWLQLTKQLINKHNYPYDKAQTYANLLIMKRFLFVGVDLYIRQNNEMKKLDIDVYEDVNHKIIIEIKICN
jgi:hypothetical protein